MLGEHVSGEGMSVGMGAGTAIRPIGSLHYARSVFCLSGNVGAGAGAGDISAFVGITICASGIVVNIAVANAITASSICVASCT